MGSREFIVALVDQGAWPLVVIVLVGIVLITQRKPIGKLLDRDMHAKAEGPGVNVEVSMKHRLITAVEEAAQPSDQLLGLVEEDRIDEVVERDVAERRLDIEQVAQMSALWGQFMHAHIPLPEGWMWLPVLQWKGDGTVDVAFVQRSLDEVGRVHFPDTLPAPDGSQVRIGHLVPLGAEEEQDAQGNGSRPS